MSEGRVSDDALAILEGVIGSGGMRKAPDLRVAGVRPGVEVLVEDVRQLEDVLKVAAEFGLAVCPTGGSTKLGWGAPPRACDLLVRTAPRPAGTPAGPAMASDGPGLRMPPLGPLAAITEYDPDNLIVTAGAGATVAALRDLAAQDGLVLPLDPPMPHAATIGGVVSTNDHGPHRMLHGSMRDVVLGLTAVLVGGERVKAGGRTIKNVTGYDLTRLFVGSLGSLGIVSEATIRLLPGSACEHVLAASLPDLAAAAGVVRRLRRSQLVPAAVEVLSPDSGRMVDDAAGGILGPGPYLVVIAFEGHAAAVERQVRDLLQMMGEGSAVVLTEPQPVALVWSAFSMQRESARRSGYDVEAKLSVPPSDLWGVLDLVQSRAAAAEADLMWTASAGSGTARLWLGSQQMVGAVPPEFVALLADGRAAAERWGGSLIVVEGVESLGSGLGSWGSDPGGLAVMRALKEKFDPRGLMNPGRSAGGL
ncbi:MAG: FAD-binding oxidoreductase [Thermoleophilia bacterium]